jgi:hypothetical protein
MRLSYVASICAAVISLSGTISAQTNISSITGTITDSSGAHMPSVHVVATQAATGLTRETTTNSSGSYFLDYLPVGQYQLSFTKEGFNQFIADQVMQNVGEKRTLNVQLLPRAGSQQVSVNEPIVQLDTVSATVGAPVEQKQVDELPINGRNWATLTSLAPGAIDNGAGDQRTIRFAGHGLDDNNLTLDGVDATAVYNQEQREYMRINIPLDSINQFQVQSQNFGADVQGGTAGGQVSVVSPSGTNIFHGDLFDYFRNNDIEARTPFNGANPNPFLLNQFGAGVGGPIIRNKTFFYANYEGLRQRLDGTQIGLVPSPAYIAQVSLANPVLIPILNAFPAGTSPTSNPNVWNYNAVGRQVDNEDSGMIRVDEHFSEKTTGFLRFNSDEATEQIPSGNLIVKTAYDTKFNNGMAELTHVFSPTLVNDFKFAVNQTLYHTASVSPLTFGVAITGFSSLTGSSTTDYPSKTFDLIDDVAWSKGKHTIKLGGEIRWVLLNQGTSQSGTLTYTSAAKFLANQMGSASYTAILPLVRQRKTQYFGYIQDEWKATSNLTITAGVRYNFFNALHAINNDDVPFDFGTCGGYCPRTDSFFHPRYNDIDPRLAIAWAHGDTVLRAGAGIYHTDGQEDDQNLPISNTTDRYSFTNTSFPTLSYPLTPFLNYAENGGLGVVSPRDLDRNRKDDYVAAWTASVQQKLPLNIVATGTYLGNKATDVLTTTYVNLVNPVTHVAPYPAFGPVSWRGDVGNATFEALQFNARRAFQHGFLLTANYMWSHSINDGSIGGGESDTPQDSFCRSCDKGSSDDDVRHVFNLSAVYTLPFHGSNGIAKTLLGNWELSAIGTAQTGLPVNITIDRTNASVPGLDALSGSERPNYNYGVSLTPAAGSTPSLWINPLAFSTPASQTFGNLGHNAFRAPGITQLDLGLSKFLTVTERLRIRFRADLFNVANRAQYGAPNADVSQSNFGTITSTISNYATGRGTPRELQLSAKIVF